MSEPRFQQQEYIFRMQNGQLEGFSVSDVYAQIVPNRDGSGFSLTQKEGPWEQIHPIAECPCPPDIDQPLVNKQWVRNSDGRKLLSPAKTQNHFMFCDGHQDVYQIAQAADLKDGTYLIKAMENKEVWFGGFHPQSVTQIEPLPGLQFDAYVEQSKTPVQLVNTLNMLAFRDEKMGKLFPEGLDCQQVIQAQTETKDAIGDFSERRLLESVRPFDNSGTIGAYLDTLDRTGEMKIRKPVTQSPRTFRPEPEAEILQKLRAMLHGTQRTLSDNHSAIEQNAERETMDHSLQYAI